MNTYKASFWIAGALLVVSAIFSQILEKNIGQVLVLGLSGVAFVILGITKQGSKQIACETRILKKHPKSF